MLTTLSWACGESPTNLRVPAAPTQFTASAFRNRITLAWAPVTGATTYNLYWSTTAGVTKETGQRLVGVASPFNHTGLVNGTAYYYVVTAENADGESVASASVSATPVNHAPVAAAGADQSVATDVTVTLHGNQSVDPDGDALSYQWSQASTPAVTLDDAAAAQPTFRSPRFLRSLKFALSVNDGELASTADTSIVTVDRFTQVGIGTDVSTANSDTETPGVIAVGIAGQRFLVVFCRQLGSPTGLVGVIVNSDASLSPAFAIASHNCEFPRPAIASDGSGFLVVFGANSGIVAAKLAPAGATFTVSSETVISTGTSNFSPVVAFDGTNFLVAWNKFGSGPNGYDIYGARVTTAGQSLGEFPIFVESGEQVEPAVAFDGANYLVIWRDTRTGSGPSESTDIYGTRVTPGGAVLDPAGIAISTASNVQGEPHLTFGGGNYFAVWSDARRYPATTQPPLDVFGTRIAPSGTLLDGPATSGGIAISTADVSPGVIGYSATAFDGTNYFVLFAVVAFTDPAGVYFKRVSTGGVLLDGPATQLGPSISGVPSFASRFVYPTIGSNGVTALVSWVDNTELAGTAKDVVGTLIEP